MVLWFSVKGSLFVDVLGNFVLYVFGNLFHGRLLKRKKPASAGEMNMYWLTVEQ